MLELDAIASVEWTPELGQKLKSIRGKVSRRALAAKGMDMYDYKVSQQYIQLLEHPEGNEKAPSTASFRLLRYLTEALDSDIYELFDSPKIIARGTGFMSSITKK
jgi:DNA topoisomerase VI subunit A